jgi:16S rRNA processing protein RimM
VSPDSNTLIALGLIVKPRGLSGELIVNPHKAGSSSFYPGLPVVIAAERISLNTKIEHTRAAGSRLGIKFEHIDDRNSAEEFRGGEVLCRFEHLPENKPDEYYVFELVGSRVLDQENRLLGLVAEVLNFPANDVLLIKSETGEVMVPMVKEFIKKISCEDKSIIIKDINDFIG